MEWTNSPTASPVRAVCGDGTLLEAHIFGDENSDPPLHLSGYGANNGLTSRPWKYDQNSDCDLDGINDNTQGLKAKDADTKTKVSFVAPQGARSMAFSYSLQRQSKVDTVYKLEVILNDDLTPSRQYGVYPDTDDVDCETECLYISGGDVVKFRCVSDNKNEECDIDNVQFWGKATTNSPHSNLFLTR